MDMNNELSEKGNTLVGGAAALVISVIIVKIIGFIYKLPLSYILGDEGMGYFNSAYSVFTFFYMICVGGIPRAVSIVIAEAKIKNEDEYANKILRVCLSLFVTVGIAFTLILLLFSNSFSKIIGNKATRFSMCCIAPSLTFVAASGVLRGYLNGVGKISKIAVAEVLEGSVKFVFGLTLALIACKKNYTPPIISAFTILGVTLGTFIGTLFMFLCVKCQKNQKASEKTKQKQNITIKSKDIIKGVILISVPITLSSAVMGVTNIIDLGIIMKRLLQTGISEKEASALYGNFTTLAVPMLNLVSAFASPISSAAMPHLTKSLALAQREEYNKLCESIIFIAVLFTVPLCISYLFFADEILALLFEDSSAKIAAPLLRALSPSVVFLPILVVLNTMLESAKKTMLPLVAMCVGSIVKIISAYFLIGTLGILGAALSTTLCYASAFFISLISAYSALTFKISILPSILIPSVSAYVIIGAGSVLYDRFGPNSFSAPKFLVFALILAVVYLLFLLIFMRKKAIVLSDYVKIAKKSRL